MHKSVFALFHVLFFVFLSCSATCRGDCFKIKTRQWQAYLEAPSALSFWEHSTPDEDDSIDEPLNTECSETTCENNVEGNTYYTSAAVAILTGNVNGEVHQIICPRYESWFASLLCRLLNLFSYMPVACPHFITLTYSDTGVPENHLMLSNWITYKKKEVGLNIIPDEQHRPDMNLINNNFFKMITDYYNTKIVTLKKPVMRDDFLEYVFLALHFCGSSEANYLNDCILSFGEVLQYAKKNDSVVTVGDFFVQSQTTCLHIWKRKGSSSEYFLLDYKDCYIGLLLNGNNYFEESTNCLSFYEQEWFPIGATLFSFKNKKGTVTTELLKKIPRKPEP